MIPPEDDMIHPSEWCKEGTRWRKSGTNRHFWVKRVLNLPEDLRETFQNGDTAYCILLKDEYNRLRVVMADEFHANYMEA